VFEVETATGTLSFCSTDCLPDCSAHEEDRESPMCKEKAAVRDKWGNFFCDEHGELGE
jgi:hypothetical protein